MFRAYGLELRGLGLRDLGFWVYGFWVLDLGLGAFIFNSLASCRRSQSVGVAAAVDGARTKGGETERVGEKGKARRQGRMKIFRFEPIAI